MANERRLIDANALRVHRGINVGANLGGIRAIVLEKDIENAPTVEAVPVVHGQWIFDFSLDDSNFYKCSICGRQEILLAKESISEYCPYCHCGAKMMPQPPKGE